MPFLRPLAVDFKTPVPDEDTRAYAILICLKTLSDAAKVRISFRTAKFLSKKNPLAFTGERENLKNVYKPKNLNSNYD